MRINTNMNALQANNQMGRNSALQANAMQKLSSGQRINKAGDDAAGLAVSEKMRAQIRGMETANRNVQDGVSMVQTAEGALQEAGNIAQRMRELSVQAANDTYSTDDRAKIKVELDELAGEIESIATETKFNGIELLSKAGDFKIQAGADTEIREVKTVDLKAAAGTLKGAVDVTDNGKAQDTIKAIDVALNAINTNRAELGAKQNRLEATSSNLTTTAENLTQAESRIRDTDVAKEMVNLSKLNILTQASQSMLAQANQQPQAVLKLLG